MSLRKYPNPNPDGSRMETGPVQFGDDWPGIFIRGDEACYIGFLLSQVLKQLKDEVCVIDRMNIENAAGLLSSCDAHAIREQEDRDAQVEDAGSPT